MKIRIAYVARIPSVPGNDLVHSSKTSAEREVKNATKAGYAGAWVEEVLLAA